MRRERKGSNKVKIITAATLATLLAAGTLNAYASTHGIQRIGVEINNQIRYLTVSDLADASNATFRSIIIGSFNEGERVWVSTSETGQANADLWREISEAVSPGDMANRAPRDVTQDPPILPYEWE